MPSVLILSSYVAASRVGGGAQALALARLGIEPILIPTVLFGRHPGHGAPGGSAVAAETLEAMLGGVEAQGLFAGLGAVITGHFSTPEQIAVAAGAIDKVRAAAPKAKIVVDPIMGDAAPGLYVLPAVAEAVATELVARADLVAPNAWELSRLSGMEIGNVEEAVAAARALGRPVLVSSAPVGDDIGVVYADERNCWLGAHAASASAPNGTGDLLTVLFTAARVEGLPIPDAFRAAVSGVAEAVLAAGGAAELPIRAFPLQLFTSPRVRVELLRG
jgi:pyridoxine kinase